MSMTTLLRIIIIPSLVKSEEQEIALKQKPTNWTISDPVIWTIFIISRGEPNVASNFLDLAWVI